MSTLGTPIAAAENIENIVKTSHNVFLSFEGSDVDSLSNIFTSKFGHILRLI